MKNLRIMTALWLALPAWLVGAGPAQWDHSTPFETAAYPGPLRVDSRPRHARQPLGDVACTIDEDCDDGNPCTADVCAAGSCSNDPNSAPCDDGNACTTGDQCSAGTCIAGAPVDCSDGEPCTDDSCDPTTGCLNTDNTDPCDDNDACTTSDTCAGGVCVGGPPLHCDDGEPCTDDSCDSSVGCITSPNSAPCDDGNACTTDDLCAGGVCVGSLPPNCDDGQVCTDDSCDPATGCVNAPNSDPCDDGDACTTGDLCANGVCVSGAPLDCADNNPCTDDLCDPASGCDHPPNSAACDDDDACTTDDLCVDGLCIGGAALDCADGNDCTTDSCDPILGCMHIPHSNACDDGDLCTVQDSCSDGVCTGSPLDCNDNDPCTDDSCAAMVGCEHVQNSATCDDLDACTTDDICSAGTCSGTPLSCNDGNDCTDDSCDPVTGCQNDPNNEPCDDGDACTAIDTCAGGQCVGGRARDCDDGNPCTDDSCDPASGCINIPNSLACDDGNACTTNDLCADGVCVSGTPLDCADSNPCTDDICDPASGCDHPPNSAICDDGDACTSGDVCTAGVCVGGGPPTCDDGNPCTDDSCDPASGCVFTPNSIPCDDGNSCTTQDMCTDTVCVGGGGPDCDDGNPCTNDSCDVELGCVNTNNTAACDDGNACTTADVCDAGTCTSGPELDCDDGNPCTHDACDPASGCVYTHNTEPCDDSDACTSQDVCAAGVCSGTNITCNDNHPCTNDACNPTSGCFFTANAAPCDDSNACTIDDACEGGACSGAPLNCEDNNPCTTDSCNPALGCVNVLNNEPCDDGNACTTGDICSLGNCIPIGALVCDDENPCTTDSCDSATGCVFTNTTVPCDDGDACTEGEVCQNGTCGGGSAVVCDDGNPCTDDSCDAVIGCTATNVAGSCDDGDPCTAGDSCVNGLCVGADDGQSTVYKIRLADLLGLSVQCDEDEFFNGQTCDLEPGFQWMDTGTAPVKEIRIAMNVGIDCHLPGAIQFTKLNGEFNAPFFTPEQVCHCPVSDGGRVIQLNLNPGNYNLGGLNTFRLANPDHTCVGLRTEPAWGFGVFAEVTVVYEPRFTIGGSVYSNLTDPLGSGAANVAVHIECTSGFEDTVVTSCDPVGLWQASNVPCGDCNLTVSTTGGGCADSFSHVIAGQIVSEAAITVPVDAENEAQNQSIQFLLGFIPFDFNGDDIVTLVGDLQPFVDCVFFGACGVETCPEPGCSCRGDCNGDGFLSIVGDVPCFVDCLFFGECAGCDRDPSASAGLTIGGAIFDRATDPLRSGVAGLEVKLAAADGTPLRSTRTAEFGLWHFDAVEAGHYIVTFGHAATSRVVIVSKTNEQANQSLIWKRPRPRTPASGRLRE